MSEEKLYPIKYKVFQGDYSQEHLEQEDAGGCDSLGMVSVMGDFGNGEPLSVSLIGIKGKTQNTWTDREWFTVWSMLADKLSQSDTLSTTQQMIAVSAIGSVRAYMRGLTPEEPKDENAPV